MLTVSECLPVRRAVLDASPPGRSQPTMRLGFIKRCSAFFADTNLALAAYFVPNAHRTASRADQLHFRNRNRTLLVGDSALRGLGGAEVFFYHRHMLHQNASGVRKHAQYAPLLTLVLAA